MTLRSDWIRRALTTEVAGGRSHQVMLDQRGSRTPSAKSQPLRASSPGTCYTTGTAKGSPNRARYGAKPVSLLNVITPQTTVERFAYTLKFRCLQWSVWQSTCVLRTPLTHGPVSPMSDKGDA